MKTIVETQLAPKAVGTYSQGTVVNGVVYFSGQVGINPETQVLETGFDNQIERTLSNIDGLLKSQNLSRTNIFKTTIFLTDLSQFSKVNQAYEKFFTPPYPARSTVEVSKLPKDALIEIEVMASANHV